MADINQINWQTVMLDNIHAVFCSPVQCRNGVANNENDLITKILFDLMEILRIITKNDNFKTFFIL